MLIPFFESHEYPLQTLFLLASCGLLLGKLFEKMRLPHISGQLAAGVILGPAALGILGANALHHVELLSEIVLGVMAFTVGTHLNHRVLHNAWGRVLKLALAESIMSFAAVWLVLSLFPMEAGMPVLLAAIAIATAPGTVVSLIQSKKARGVLVKTLLGIVALNNVLAILFFEFFKIHVLDELGGSPSSSGMLLLSLRALLPVGGSILAGGLTGLLFVRVIRHYHTVGNLFVSGSLLILLNLAIAHDITGFSGLLVNLASGVLIGNMSEHTKRMLPTFDHVNALLHPVFFTLAGTHLAPGHLKAAGVAALLFVSSRAVAKMFSVKLLSVIGKYPKAVGNYLGMALLPQAGLAIGLIISMGATPLFQGTPMLAAVTATVLAAVAINELIGPISTSFAFDRAQETGQGKPRLIDFLHEEFILTSFRPTDKWQAIRALCEFLVKTHNLKKMSVDELYELAATREKEFTTGVGKRFAIPHIRFPYKGDALLGVIGILDTPLEFESLDDAPVSIIVLLLTPKGKEDQHVKVCASLGEVFTRDPQFQERLIAARSPAEAYDLLQSKEIRELNYFWDEVE